MRKKICTSLIIGIFWIILPLIYPLRIAGAGKVPDAERLTFVFYNVENLYDTQDDPFINDQEFLPGAKKQWTFRRYTKKINDISRVIRELGGSDLPDVVGLCEVENDNVLISLVNQTNLRGAHYRIVHFNDRDSRGIDLALLYKPDKIQLISQELVPVKSSKGGTYARGILYVTVQVANGEIFHIFVNHWPSRENNDAEKERGRRDMAQKLR